MWFHDDIVQWTYQGFNHIFPNLQPKEKRQFLQILIKEMTIYKDRVKLSLYEVPEIAFSISNSHSLCEPSSWLPGLDDIDNKSRCLRSCIAWLPGLDNVDNNRPKQLPIYELQNCVIL